MRGIGRTSGRDNFYRSYIDRNDGVRIGNSPSLSQTDHPLPGGPALGSSVPLHGPDKTCRTRVARCVLHCLPLTPVLVPGLTCLLACLINIYLGAHADGECKKRVRHCLPCRNPPSGSLRNDIGLSTGLLRLPELIPALRNLPWPCLAPCRDVPVGSAYHPNHFVTSDSPDMQMKDASGRLSSRWGCHAPAYVSAHVVQNIRNGVSNLLEPLPTWVSFRDLICQPGFAGLTLLSGCTINAAENGNPNYRLRLTPASYIGDGNVVPLPQDVRYRRLRYNLVDIIHLTYSKD